MVRFLRVKSPEFHQNMPSLQQELRVKMGRKTVGAAKEQQLQPLPVLCTPTAGVQNTLGASIVIFGLCIRRSIDAESTGLFERVRAILVRSDQSDSGQGHQD